MIEALRIAELLCARLCHDLTGPIGAVHNGAEFLNEEGFNLQGQAVELIVSSAFSAVTRLQFYRIAYGKLKEHGEANLAEKQKLASDFFLDTKITLDWPDTHTDSVGVSVSLKMSRILFNLLIIAAASLIRGGVISVRITQDAQNRYITVTAQGPGLKWEQDMEKAFGGELAVADLTPKNVQFYLAKMFADELYTKLTHQPGNDELVLVATQPLGATTA